MCVIVHEANMYVQSRTCGTPWQTLVLTLFIPLPRPATHSPSMPEHAAGSKEETCSCSSRWSWRRTGIDTRNVGAVGKRKLSASASQGPEDTQIKRSKSETQSEAVDQSAAGVVVVPTKSKEAPESQESDDEFEDESDEDEDEYAEEYKGSSTNEQGNVVETFYMGKGELFPLLVWGNDDDAALRLKSAVLETWARVKDDKEERERCPGGIEQWLVTIEKDAHKTDGCQRLGKMYDARCKDNWWWEVDLQREQPKEGEASMEVELRAAGARTVDKWEGVWWVTDLRVPSEEGLQAITTFAGWLSDILTMS
ncbi:hypothetical protein OF83DRAFT_240618 [Amylostereum chailletii]|nr:hypothetical protein OF83DRAFT_240618 [Amylostereum chailletii]